MTRSTYLRSGDGDRDFERVASSDPFGPRFPVALVASADRLLLRVVEAETVDRGELHEWRLFAGERLLGERRLLGRGLAELGIEG